jgi:hypothetical protein
MRNTSDWHTQGLRMVRLFVVLGLIISSSSCLNKNKQPNPILAISPGHQDQIDGAPTLTAAIAVPEQIEACDPLPLDFTITNAGQTGVYLLKWYTPLEGVLGNIFEITYQGEELDYLGPMVMRGAPLPENYIYLKPGEFIKESVNLAVEYSFHQPGDYGIQFRSPRISDTVSSEEEFASSLEDLGPVKIPSLPAAFRVLPAEAGEDCQPAQGSSRQVSEAAPMIHIRGVIREASPSLRVIWLAEAVDGFDSIALTEGTVLTDQKGTLLALMDIKPGEKIEAAGFPGTPGTLLAEEVTISR